jgi:uncharacterized membrane protein YdjX (TVP38/TMEM64 family)
MPGGPVIELHLQTGSAFSRMNRKLKLFMAALLGVGIALALIYREQLEADRLTLWITGFGLLAPLAFCTLRVLAAVLLVPGSLMGIAAGAAFGLVPGAVYNLLSSTVGAVAAFAIARFIAPNRVHRMLLSRAAVARLIAGVNAEGWRFVAFVRLVPLFPYNLVNYAFGLTGISLLEYTLATLVCMIPGDIAYVYIGYAARETIAGDERAWQLGLGALGVLAALALLPRIARALRRVDGGPPLQ